MLSCEIGANLALGKSCERGPSTHRGGGKGDIGGVKVKVKDALSGGGKGAPSGE